MQKLYDFENYKNFVNAWILERPGKGRGEFRRMAEHLRVHATLLSQIFRGAKDLSEEQALELSSYLGLNEQEKEYFLILVQFEKAGSKNLKLYFEKKIKVLSAQAKQVSSRVPKNKEMGLEASGIFYSSWHYAAIRLLTGTSGKHSVESISQRLGLTKTIVREALDFLLKHGLVQETKLGFQSGSIRTHLPANSPYVSRHHLNWRAKSIERHIRLTEEEIVYTAPLSIATKDIPKIRKMILNFVEDVSKTVGPSAPEELMCLAIDWTKIG